MTSELAFALRYNRGVVFKVWVRRLWSTGFCHGGTLVFLLGTPFSGKPGLTDNVWAAEQLLEAAVAAGWIEKGKNPTPDRQQRFFGIGGSSGLPVNRFHSSVEYGYEPNRQCKEFSEWVSSDAVNMDDTASPSEARK